MTRTPAAATFRGDGRGAAPGRPAVMTGFDHGERRSAGPRRAGHRPARGHRLEPRQDIPGRPSRGRSAGGTDLLPATRRSFRPDPARIRKLTGRRPIRGQAGNLGGQPAHRAICSATPPVRRRCSNRAEKPWPTKSSVPNASRRPHPHRPSWR